MDIQDKIQLNEHKFIDAVNVDTSIKIPLDSNSDLNIEYDIQNVLDVTQVFDIERQESKKYRIHGEFEYFSLLNGLFKEYTNLEYFFTKLIAASADTKTIFSDLKFYVVKPSTNFTSLNNEKYIKNYEIIGDNNNVEIIPAAFSKNIFDEQQYSFIINFDVDIENLIDGLGFPLTEISLYIEYQPSENGVGTNETMERNTYDANGNSIIENFTPITLNIGDIIQGDVIEYNKLLFEQTDFNLLEHYIYTSYQDTLGSGTGSGQLKWKYTPIIPIRLRYFENEVRRANTGTSAYEEIIEIPPYATSIDIDGNYVWRNILDNGFFDPIENIGVSFPFINQRHYIFNNLIFKTQPDLDHTNTASIFDDILFDQNELINAEPNSSLDNIGEICN